MISLPDDLVLRVLDILSVEDRCAYDAQVLRLERLADRDINVD